MKSTTKFLQQLGRMCDSYDSCCKCPINHMLKDGEFCLSKMATEPEKAQNIVSGWSKANPIKPQNTILSEFIAKFPETKLNEDGTPSFCVKVLGYDYIGQDMCTANKGACTLCWNTPLIEEEKSAPTPMSEPKSDGIIIIDMTADSDPDGAYFDHAPIVKTPDFPSGMDTFIKELCVKLGWDKPVITA